VAAIPDRGKDLVEIGLGETPIGPHNINRIAERTRQHASPPPIRRSSFAVRLQAPDNLDENRWRRAAEAAQPVIVSQGMQGREPA
jgi:hypothetical protein